MSRADLVQGIIENFSRLSHSGGKRHRLCTRRLGGVELSPAQIGVMHAISHHRIMTTNKIAESIGVTKSAVSQVAEPLVKEGLLERTTDLQDRRIAHLSVTHKGHRLMHLAKRHAVEDAREAFDALSDDELKLLLELSQKIAKQN
jgi:DNA-binding MarR family transcriptional regulator